MGGGIDPAQGPNDGEAGLAEIRQAIREHECGGQASAPTMATGPGQQFCVAAHQMGGGASSSASKGG